MMCAESFYYLGLSITVAQNSEIQSGETIGTNQQQQNTVSLQLPSPPSTADSTNVAGTAKEDDQRSKTSRFVIFFN